MVFFLKLKLAGGTEGRIRGRKQGARQGGNWQPTKMQVTSWANGLGHIPECQEDGLGSCLLLPAVLPPSSGRVTAAWEARGQASFGAHQIITEAPGAAASPHR